MNIPIIGIPTDTIDARRFAYMETMFYTLHDFMVATKASVYILMAFILIGITAFWFFLNGRGSDD